MNRPAEPGLYVIRDPKCWPFVVELRADGSLQTPTVRYPDANVFWEIGQVIWQRLEEKWQSD